MKTQIDDPRWAEAVDAYNAGEWVRALSLLQSMAADDITQVYSKIGCIYEYGYNGKYGKDRGVKQSYDEALKWHQKAFESGYASGALGMARIYLNDGDQRNYDKAFHCLSIARKFHVPEVYRALGMLYDTGNGIKQDKEKAKLMYLRAVAKGDKTAFVPIGVILAKSGHRLKGNCLILYGLFKSLSIVGHTAWVVGQSGSKKRMETKK